LFDDFAATGTSFLRYDEDKKEWKGKLVRFRESVEGATLALEGDRIFAPAWELCVHHYVGPAAAAESIVGGCGLPLVLDHNTPNNSVALLWAETDGGDRDGAKVPAMRPLFRRRQRHS
jgi:hypothetical protein